MKQTDTFCLGLGPLALHCTRATISRSKGRHRLSRRGRVAVTGSRRQELRACASGGRGRWTGATGGGWGRLAETASLRRERWTRATGDWRWRVASGGLAGGASGLGAARERNRDFVRQSRNRESARERNRESARETAPPGRGIEASWVSWDWRNRDWRRTGGRVRVGWWAFVGWA